MRYILVLEVENISPEPFNVWPLHCTLVPWFEFDGDGNELIKELNNLFNKSKYLELTTYKETKFGNKIPVTLIKKTEDLQLIHEDTIRILEKCGVSFNTLYGDKNKTIEYIKNNYSPHITHKKGRKLEIGKTHTSKKIYLAKSLSETPKIRQIFSEFNLRGK